MRFAFNDVARSNGWEEWPYVGTEDYIELHEIAGTTSFDCKVIGMSDQTYGKMPEEDAQY